MKCSVCEKKECERKYKNRDKCVGKEEGIKYTCTCQVSSVETIATSAASISTFTLIIADTQKLMDLFRIC